MFRKQRISLYLIVFGLLFVVGAGLKAHWYHIASIPDLSFKSDPTVSCNIDGYTFTHTRQTYSDGVIYEDGWWRNPQDPIVKMTAETHGAGWAHVLFYGNIDGAKRGDDTNTTPHKLGGWTGLIPFGVGIDTTIEASFKGTFNRSPKTYKWDVSGSVKLVPYYWHWEFPGVGSSWQPAPSDFHTTKTFSPGGSWLVERNWTTLTRSSPGSGGGSGSGSNPVVEPPPSDSPAPDPPAPKLTMCSDCYVSYDPLDADSSAAHQQVTCANCGESFKDCQNNEPSCTVASSGWCSTVWEW
ncbi:MAG: hypothetical protein OXL96_11755 [Candidatus Poribacteria bacterium]|nr:hypothetical protein [Candidatus Poribacteria bacterium]